MQRCQKYTTQTLGQCKKCVYRTSNMLMMFHLQVHNTLHVYVVRRMCRADLISGFLREPGELQWSVLSICKRHSRLPEKADHEGSQTLVFRTTRNVQE